MHARAHPFFLFKKKMKNKKIDKETDLRGINSRIYFKTYYEKKRKD